MTGELQVALRHLAKSKLFAVTACTLLALAIGANCAVFSVVDGILLHPMPFKEPDRLIQISGLVLPKGWLLGLRELNHSFEQLAAYSLPEEFNLGALDGAQRIRGNNISANLLPTLGANPMLGRSFRAEEDYAGADRVVLLSYPAWRVYFQGRQDIVGQPVKLDGVERQVIGVMPQNFAFPDAQAQIWIPLGVNRASVGNLWGQENLRIVARLKPTVTSAMALSEMKSLQPELVHRFPWTMPDGWGSDVAVVGLQFALVSSVKERLVLLLGAAILVFAISCANLSLLLLSRTINRFKELGIRAALGASLRHVARQLVAENLVLVALGGTAGIALGAVLLRAVLWLIPPTTPRIGEVGLHLETVLFALSLCGLTVALCSAVSIRISMKPDLNRVLNSQAGNVSPGRLQMKFSNYLVGADIALCVVVIVIGAQLAETVYHLEHIRSGFRTTHLVSAELAVTPANCSSPSLCLAQFTAVLEQLRAQPGIRNAALIDYPVLKGDTPWYGFHLKEERGNAKRALLQGWGHITSEGYFSTMGIPLIEGRSFVAEDENPDRNVVVIDESMAKELWPGQSAVGKQIEPVPGNKLATVIGVVGDTRHESLEEKAGIEVYTPLNASNVGNVISVVAESDAPIDYVLPRMRQAARMIDSAIAISKTESIETAVSESITAQKSLMKLFFAFSASSLILSFVGIYSLMTYSVSWRQREIGVRMALGATRTSILLQILKRATGIAMLGGFVGIALAIGVTQLIASLLFEVRTVSFPILASAVAVCLLVAVVGSLVPALRAAAMDPRDSLREG